MIEKLNYIDIKYLEDNKVLLTLNASGGPIISGPNALTTYKKFEEAFQLCIAVEMLMNYNIETGWASNFINDTTERRKQFANELKVLTKYFDN